MTDVVELQRQRIVSLEQRLLETNQLLAKLIDSNSHMSLAIAYLTDKEYSDRILKHVHEAITLCLEGVI